MRIEVQAKLILTIPEPDEKDLPNEIKFMAEQYINDTAPVFEMPKTKTKVGIRIHVG